MGSGLLPPKSLLSETSLSTNNNARIFEGSRMGWAIILAHHIMSFDEVSQVRSALSLPPPPQQLAKIPTGAFGWVGSETGMIRSLHALPWREGEVVRA